MEKRIIYRVAVLLMVLPVFLQGCNKDDSQERWEEEMRLLNQYILDKNIIDQPTSSGLYYIEMEAGTGNRAALEDLVDFNYTTELIDGTVVGTSDEELAVDKSIFEDTKMYGPIRSMIGYTGVPGVDEGLLYMYEKGISKMIVPSNIGGIYPSDYTTKIYTIELVNTFNDPEQFQSDQILSYLKDHQIDSTFVTPTGLHYIEDTVGTGLRITTGVNVQLWYTGTFLDGRVFDSNRNGTVMSVTMPATNYIAAWDEALRLMSEGTIARIIVPYNLAYGAQGQGSVPPYMPLVFDIEIVKVSPI